MTTATVTARPYAGENDLPAIADMVNACEAVDHLDMATSVDTLRDEFSSPGFDPARDLRLWHDEDGNLVGFGQLWLSPEASEPDAFLWYIVHPSARNSQLDAQILDWGAQRTREAIAECGTQMRLRVVAHDHEPQRIAALERANFEVDRYFWRMGVALDGPLAESRLPEGFALAAGPHDPETWAALYNQSFVDHWNHIPKTAEQVLHEQQEGSYLPDLDLVALAPDGTPAGFCKASMSHEHNALHGANTGDIALLGTRRGFRNQGLGRTMLLVG
ncbi:MAG TPA: hypothetical protein VFX76_19340, partial [Roseiflexaceae bacterium]|nr:hypothetical protein [Roseiflexaceae bacterium]